MSYVLGFDIGTTSTIGALIELPTRIVAVVSRPVRLNSPKPGWAEEDPAEWWANVCEISHELLLTAGVAGTDIAAIGVTGMLPAVVLLDEHGDVLRPSIQQSDGRSGKQVARMRGDWDEREFIAKAGNGINQQLIGAKLRWIAENEPDVYARIRTVFGSYDYVNWKLTGEKAIEQNWALEAGIVDIKTHAVDDALVRFTEVRPDAFPRKSISHEILGQVSAEAARATGLAEGTTVVGGAADMIASALGAGIVSAGDVLLKFGGAIDILTATDRVMPDPRMFFDYHLVPGLFMPNGCMATGGSGLNWFAQNFAGREAMLAEAEGISVHQYLDRLAAACRPGAEGLMVLPYFLGEKTPIHDPQARGVFSGLTLSHSAGHLWRALLEGYAFAVLHHIEVLRDMGHRTETYVASDGGSKSRVWMQIVADVLQKPVQLLRDHHGSCIGAAWTAAIGAGLTDDWSGAARFASLADRLEPDPANAELYAGTYRRYRETYERLSADPRMLGD